MHGAPNILHETPCYLKTTETNKFNSHIPALDGVRGFAAATVFLLHYGGGAQSTFLPLRLAGKALHLGWAGVSLFFVLSGFLITGILWDGFHREHWWRNFYIRRSLRIFPLYYLALLIALVISLTVDAAQKNSHSLLVYAFYLQDIPPLMDSIRPLPHALLGHFWSLAVEEQFYFIWPFLLFAFHGKSRRYALGLCASGWLLSLAYRIAVVHSHFSVLWAVSFLAGRAGELCAGGFLAIAVRGSAVQRERFIRKAPYAIGAGLAALAVTLILSRSTLPENPWIGTLGLSAFSLLFTGVVAACLYRNLIQTFFSNRLLRWLGKISYGIYVYHILFRPQFIWIAVHLAPHASRDMLLIVTAVVALVGTAAVSVLSFYAYERFFLGLKDRFSVSKPVELSVAAR
jgi:peptidoglycan/LPS O-acetylase OafA/YrhL